MVGFVGASFGAYTSFSVAPIIAGVPTSFDFQVPFPSADEFKSYVTAAAHSEFLSAVESTRNNIFPW